MKMKINVTEEDIEKGKRYCGWMCPVANAMFRTTGWKWQVDYGMMHPIASAKDEIYVDGQTLHKIVEFDREGWMEPFEFEADIPEKFTKVSNGVLAGSTRTKE